MPQQDKLLISCRNLYFSGVEHCHGRLAVGMTAGPPGNMAMDDQTDARVADTVQDVLHAPRRPLLRRNRIVLVLVACVQALALLAFAFYGWFLGNFDREVIASPPILNTAFANMVATLLGYWMTQQFETHPGVRSYGYVIPSMASSFGAIAILMLFMRTEYSRGLILVGFLFAVVAFTGFLLFLERRTVPLLALIPGGNLRGVTAIKQANWLPLKTVQDFQRDCTGIVVDLSADLSDSWERFIAKGILAGIPVHDVRGVIESFTGRVEVEHLAENSFGSTLPSNSYLRIKRLIDFLMAILLLPFVLVVLAVAVCAIKMESSGDAMFSQQRMGFRGHPFWIYKLRSMHIDAAEGAAYTAKDDPRITRVGKFIRKYRVDELPQIFNIIRGEMSWIGPRPESVLLADVYAAEIPFHIYRHAVRPGITGWAQVTQGNVGEVEDEILKLQFDFYYIKNFSPWLDVLITIKTIRTILTGFGST